MENSKAVQPEKEKSNQQKLVFTSEEKQRLVDFFVVLIEIDHRENVTKFYAKPNK